jgi:TonB family protein
MWTRIPAVNVKRGTLEVEEWRPPECPQDPPARSRQPISSRGLARITVIALHVGIVALFALPTVLIDRANHVVAPVITATFIDAEQSPVETPAELQPPLLESPIALPDSGSFAFPTIELVEADTPESNEFRPPRLEENHVTSPERFVMQAGLAVAQTARVILTVTVTEQGKAGEVSVAVGSGNAELDLAAIGYARTLRWHPAVVRGRESSMSIRLPVVFPATG